MQPLHVWCLCLLAYWLGLISFSLADEYPELNGFVALVTIVPTVLTVLYLLAKGLGLV